MTPEQLLQRAQEAGGPIVDGPHVTFVWQGESAPEIIGDFNNWGGGPIGSANMTRIAPLLWTYETDLPEDAYVEYVYTNDPDDDDTRLLDPLNPRQVSNGMGGFNNTFSMPGREHTTLNQFVSGTPQGHITRHTITAPELLIGGRRTVWLYNPPTTDPVPLIVVYDGRDYLRRAEITQIVANMIAQDMIQPVALAMIDNGREGRFIEYLTSDATLRAVTDLVLPLAKNVLTLVDVEANPGAYGVLGASMGGLMALYTGLRQPHLFGTVMSQAGAFNIGVTNVDPLIVKLVKDASTKPIRVWQDVGTLDWLLEANHEMRDLLQSKGYTLTYQEYTAGHNYTAWRDALPLALKAMYGK